MASRVSFVIHTYKQISYDVCMRIVCVALLHLKFDCLKLWDMSRGRKICSVPYQTPARLEWNTNVAVVWVGLLHFFLKIILTLTSNVDHDEMQHYAAFHLGLHSVCKSTRLGYPINEGLML